MGRTDLHNHMLFGVDDGAADAAESLAIARALVNAGYTDVVTTPHARPELDPAEALVSARRQEVQALLDAEGIRLRLHEGCENHLTPAFLERVEAGHARPLGAGPYVLVELPFAAPVPGLRQMLFEIMLKGLRPILAHPERCAHFVGRPEVARELFEAGAHFQIEIGSLGGHYGPAARKCAQQLLADDLVAAAATDVHHIRSGTEILTTGLKALGKALGPTRLALLTEENPARILRGDVLA